MLFYVFYFLINYLYIFKVSDYASQKQILYIMKKYNLNFTWQRKLAIVGMHSLYLFNYENYFNNLFKLTNNLLYFK